jgi:hypothetical protein
MNNDNLKNCNLQTGEEDDLAAILNQRNARAEMRRNLSSPKPSHSFNSGSKARKDALGGVPPLRGRFRLGLSKSFSERFSGVAAPLKRRLDRVRAGRGEEAEEEVNEEDGKYNESSNDLHSLDEIVIAFKNEDGQIDHIDNASSNSVGSDGVARNDQNKEEEEYLHSQDNSCDQSVDGSGVASFSKSASSGIFNSRFSDIFKGKRSDSGTAQTHPDDDSDQESHATKSVSQYYTLEDHSDFLRLSAETNGWRYCDIGHILTESHIPNLVKDYISPVLSFEHLKKAYFGVKRTLFSETDQGESRPEPLPIRTLAFRVRPDVSSQTIMGAVENSFSDIPESIALTHQEGHYRCVMTSIPCIFDAQLCVATSEPFERTILLRVYHAHDDETAMEKIDGIVEPSTLKDNEELMAFSTHLHLRQASSLVQLFSAENASPQTPCPKETPSDTSAYLMSKYESGPSVSEHTTDESANLLPALSAEDWFIVQSSEPLCIRVWKMLSKVNCAFQTISTKPLEGLTAGAGSAIIDPSFCLQLQQLSYEVLMIKELRATKDDAIERHNWILVERYLHFLQVLNNMWKLYNIIDDRPSYLPEETPVSEALLTPDYLAMAEKIAAEYPNGPEKDGEDAQAPSKEDPKSPEHVVDGIVGDIYAAYSKLNGEEFRAYCEGKNTRIFARVNQIEKHEKEIIRILENPRTDEMQSVATEFNALVAKVTKREEVSDDEPVEVPILKVPTSGTGMCYVTASKIIYSTTGLLGKTLIFDLDAVQLKATSAACMTILLKNGERSGCKIWPSSLDANHLTEFIETLISLQLVVECRE